MAADLSMAAERRRDEKLRNFLAETLGNTGYSFLARRVAAEPTFGEVMMEAMRLAYEAGWGDGLENEN